ncbi:hypothetical protein BCR43DRAFT_559168 [Syncephalastrum racemosum]|uniref:RPA-interacting protein C-terminal domain-containing protein n=1 Tax=Syncephalastrum racemosum TaxID=13706 RepID=A0A1X2HRD6_SYNRA|nr:hypothetical protein BCR43DRAFT_559168 [Syncephalastrum racemosum]
MDMDIQRPRVHRESIKRQHNRPEALKDRVRQKYANHMKDARRAQINRRRETNLQYSAHQEWQEMQQMYEQALQHEELNPDFFLEEEDQAQGYASNSNPSQILDTDLTCFACHGAKLQQSGTLTRCPACYFTTSEKGIRDMQEQEAIHAEECPGRLAFGPEPGCDTILSMCDTCDWLSII